MNMAPLTGKVAVVAGGSKGDLSRHFERDCGGKP